MPVRIQRKRTKGWRAPANAVYVGRPTKFGNPFRPEACSGGRAEAVERFRQLATRKFRDTGDRLPSIAEIQRELRGKDLMCFCGTAEVCHADVLLAIANMPEVQR